MRDDVVSIGFVALLVFWFTIMLVLILSPTTAEATCSYFEEAGFVTLTDGDLCLVSFDNESYTPVENLIDGR